MQPPEIRLGDVPVQDHAARDLAVNDGVAELILAIYEGPLIALHGAPHRLIADAVGDDLEVVLLGQLAAAVDVLGADPLQPVVIRIVHITPGHKARAGAQIEYTGADHNAADNTHAAKGTNFTF